MYCTDFIFDNERLSDHGYMICDFGAGDSTWSGGDVTFTSMQSPGTNTFTHYYSKFDTPLSFNFSIMKNPCGGASQKDLYFTQDEQSYVMRWLQRLDGYHWFAFDQEGWEDIWFRVQMNLQSHYNGGIVIGYDVTCTADSPYGYSQLHTKDIVLSSSANSPAAGSDSITIKNYSDIPGYIYPRLTITPENTGTIKLLSGCEGYKKITTIENAPAGNTIILDGNNDEITGLHNMNDFNFIFPVMANGYRDIDTTFVNIGDMDVQLKIQYRFIRRVTV